MNEVAAQVPAPTQSEQAVTSLPNPWFDRMHVSAGRPFVSSTLGLESWGQASLFGGGAVAFGIAYV